MGRFVDVTRYIKTDDGKTRQESVTVNLDHVVSIDGSTVTLANGEQAYGHISSIDIYDSPEFRFMNTRHVPAQPGYTRVMVKEIDGQGADAPGEIIIMMFPVVAWAVSDSSGAAVPVVAGCKTVQEGADIEHYVDRPFEAIIDPDGAVIDPSGDWFPSVEAYIKSEYSSMVELGWRLTVKGKAYIGGLDLEISKQPPVNFAPPKKSSVKTAPKAVAKRPQLGVE